MFNSILRQFHHGLKAFFFDNLLEGSFASELIISRLLDTKPVMIARFGSTEIKAILHPYLPLLVRLIFKNRIFNNMELLSGFFPSNSQTIGRFSELMLEDIKLLDILGSWRIEELYFEKFYPNAKKVHLWQLEPYFQKYPWSIALKDKNVLVIHPFSETIERQYHSKREYLFNNPDVLPKFKSLQTIKAVQTIAGQKSEFEDWFSALEFMKSEVDKKDFDIAIIGCGAYGFPLAAHIKRIGKKAIHLGGATQILFGIKGKRWLSNPKFNGIINEHFVFPSENEKVPGAEVVENSCYW